MVKPQFETYRYVGEVCKLKSQSIVECRLPGSEVSGVLAVRAQAVIGESACSDGEVQYGGKVLLCIVYEDGEKKVCRAERGAEFFHKAEGEAVTPACFAKPSLSVENVSWRREGSGLYVTVVVNAAIGVYGTRHVDHLSAGEGMVVNKDTVPVYRTVGVSGETEGEDEFDLDYVGDILLHNAHAIVHRVQVSSGEVDVEGEFALNLCALKSDDTLCSYERLIPFKMNIPSEDGFGNVTAGAKVQVRSTRLAVDVDEEKNASHAVLSYSLLAECFLTAKEEISLAKDAFSPIAEIEVKKQNDGGMYLMKQTKGGERIGGSALLSPELDEEYVLQAALLPRAEMTVQKGENGMEAVGAVIAEAVFLGADGTHRSATLTLPFVFPVDVSGEKIDADCMVCGLNVRRKKGGETEAECTLKFSLRCYERREWSYVSEAAVGEEYPENDSAFSVFMAAAGEELWEVAKRLRCVPEELKKSNPNLEFPLKKDEKMYVYRQI